MAHVQQASGQQQRPLTSTGRQRPQTSDGNEREESVVFGNDIAWNELGLDDDAHDHDASSAVVAVPIASSSNTVSLSSSPRVPASVGLARVTAAINDHHSNRIGTSSGIADSSRSNAGISPAIAMPLLSSSRHIASNGSSLPISSSFSASVNMATIPANDHKHTTDDDDHDDHDGNDIDTLVQSDGVAPFSIPIGNNDSIRLTDWAERDAALVRAFMSMSTGQPQPYAYPHYPAASTPPRGLSRNGIRASRVGGGLPSSSLAMPSNMSAARVAYMHGLAQGVALASHTSNSATNGNTTTATSIGSSSSAVGSSGSHVPIRLGAARGHLRMLRSHEYDDMTPSASKSGTDHSDIIDMNGRTDSGRIGTLHHHTTNIAASNTSNNNGKRHINDDSDRKRALDHDDDDDDDGDSKDEKKSPRDHDHDGDGDNPWWQSSIPVTSVNDSARLLRRGQDQTMVPPRRYQPHRIRDLNDSDSDGHDEDDDIDMSDTLGLSSLSKARRDASSSASSMNHDRDLGLELGLMEQCRRCHHTIPIGTAAMHICAIPSSNVSMGANPISFQMGAPSFGRRPSRVTYPGGGGDNNTAVVASSSSSSSAAAAAAGAATRQPSYHRGSSRVFINSIIAAGDIVVSSSVPTRHRRAASPPPLRALGAAGAAANGARANQWHYPADLVTTLAIPAPGDVPTLALRARPLVAGGAAAAAGARIWADDIDVIDARAHATINVPIGGYSTRTCILCLQDRPSYDMIPLQICSHEACKSCMAAYLDSMLKDRSKYPFVCFTPDCGAKLMYYDVARTLTSAQLSIYDHFSIVAAYDPKDLVECPWPSCGYLMVSATTDGNAMKRCVGCHRAFCNSCHIPWHQSQTCAQYLAASATRQVATREEKVNEAALQALARAQNWSACPRCHQLVEKNGGCNHMRHYRKEGCTVAAPLLPGAPDTCTHFCACCGAQLNDTNHRHDLHGRLHFARGLFEACIDANKPMFVRRDVGGDVMAAAGVARAAGDAQIGVQARRRRCIIM